MQLRKTDEGIQEPFSENLPDKAGSADSLSTESGFKFVQRTYGRATCLAEYDCMLKGVAVKRDFVVARNILPHWSLSDEDVFFWCHKMINLCFNSS